MERLEQIIDRLDSGQAGLRETLDLCREGRELVTYCAAELDAVGEGLKELKLDELAAKLDASAEPAGAASSGLSRGRSGPGSRGRAPSALLDRGDRELAGPMRAIAASRRSRPAAISAGAELVTTGSSGRSRKT